MKMKKKRVSRKVLRYGTVSVLLTVLVVTVAVLANAVMSTLSERYDWYPNMIAAGEFEVSEDCYAVIGDGFDRYGSPDLEIIFCTTEDRLVTNEYTRQLLKTANAIASRFENVSVSCRDILTDPTTVRAYTYLTDPVTGEVTQLELEDTSVIVTGNGNYRVYALAEFYAIASSDSSIWGYRGEQKLAAALLHAADPQTHLACFVTNHGETPDNELRFLIYDAGYTLANIDLYADPIPANCELLISCAPTSDWIDAEEDHSEIETLSDFLAEDGHQLLVFLGNASPKLSNLEAFLAEWGVSARCTMRDGKPIYRYRILDDGNSLTSDGTTVYGVRSESAERVSDALPSEFTVFKSVTALAPAATGYAPSDGVYRSTDGKRTMIPLYQSGNSATAWANGAMVNGDAPFLFATLTEETHTGGGQSSVAVFASTGFQSEEFLQSAVYRNRDALLSLLGATGNTATVAGLRIKPIASFAISSVTTAQAFRLTVILTAIPIVVFAAAGVVVLIRRRRK